MYNHEQRLKIGEQLSQLILDAHGDSVLAVLVVGSVAKGLDRPYSDLEMVTIVRDGVEIPSKYYLDGGLVIDIGYEQESKYLMEARRMTLRWSIQADQFRNYVTLFERDRWTQKLKEAVAENDRADTKEAIRQATMDLTETLHVLRNAQLANDEWIIKARGLSVASGAANVVLLLNRRYVTTTSWFWRQVLECPVKPSKFLELIETAAGFSSSNPSSGAIVEACEQMYQEILELVKSRGISIETDRLEI